jgi:hypothetical protein
LTDPRAFGDEGEIPMGTLKKNKTLKKNLLKRLDKTMEK